MDDHEAETIAQQVVREFDIDLMQAIQRTAPAHARELALTLKPVLEACYPLLKAGVAKALIAVKPKKRKVSPEERERLMKNLPPAKAYPSPPREELVAALEKNNWTINQAYKLFQHNGKTIGEHTFRRWLKAADPPVTLPTKAAPSREDMFKVFQDHRYNKVATAEHFGIAVGTLRKWFNSVEPPIVVPWDDDTVIESEAKMVSVEDIKQGE